MKISDWARQQHIHPRTAQRWFEAGNLPVPARRLPSGTILVEEPTPQDGRVGTIVVEHRDRLARLGSEYIEAALLGAGRRLLVVDPTEVEDDLVRDMTYVLTSLCARLYGRRSARTRAQRALRCAERPVEAS